MIVEPALTSRDDRERLTQLAFEVFNVAAYYAVDSAVASVYGVAKLSGVVLDIGYEKIGERAIPIPSMRGGLCSATYGIGADAKTCALEVS